MPTLRTSAGTQTPTQRASRPPRTWPRARASEESAREEGWNAVAQLLRPSRLPWPSTTTDGQLPGKLLALGGIGGRHWSSTTVRVPAALAAAIAMRTVRTAMGPGREAVRAARIETVGHLRGSGLSCSAGSVGRKRRGEERSGGGGGGPASQSSPPTPLAALGSSHSCPSWWVVVLVCCAWVVAWSRWRVPTLGGPSSGPLQRACRRGRRGLARPGGCI